MNKTQLVIVPGRSVTTDSVFTLLVAETGEYLASHLCSNYSFAMGDLYENRSERKEELKKRFGEVDVKYIDDLDLTEDELVERNNAWFESLEEENP